MRFQVTSKLHDQAQQLDHANCQAENSKLLGPHGESTSAESAATDARNDELTATGGSQMLATRNRGDRHAVISYYYYYYSTTTYLLTVMYSFN